MKLCPLNREYGAHLTGPGTAAAGMAVSPA
jgi:hypothetical protein